VTVGDGPNYGIVGNVTATNLVVGSHGRIDATAAADLSARVAELERALAAFEGPPETRAQLSSAVGEVTSELGRPEPNKGKLLSSLTTIGTVSGAAGSIAEAATGLVALVEHLL
jgi:hypothetical protein